MTARDKIKKLNTEAEQGATLYERSVGSFNKIIYEEIDLKIYDKEQLVKTLSSIDIPRFLGNIQIRRQKDV